MIWGFSALAYLKLRTHMHILPSSSPVFTNRAPALFGACCLTVAVCLSGCASKNPLIDIPATRTTAATTTPSAETKPATAVAAAETSPATGTHANTSTHTEVAAPTGFKRALWFFSPYRFNIQQGNFISQEMVTQLKQGMTRDQVRFLLGTALISDVFHADRWDYLFRLQKGNGAIDSSRVSIFFKDGKMTHFEGGDLPTEQDYITRIAGPAIGKKK
jgi:outer membrane protein assembly factor BamE